MSIQTKTMVVKSDTALAETKTIIRDTVTFDTSKLPNGITYKGLKAVLSFADPIQWNKASTYDSLTVVWDDATHASYASKRPVPQNIELTNEFYWVRTADLDAQVEQYRQEVSAYAERVETLSVNLENEIKRATASEAAIKSKLDTLVSLGFKSVKDYGAVGDGITDDTSAIQQCVNENELIVIPSGIYKLTDTINVTKPNFRIIGAGRTNAILKQYGNGKAVLAISGTKTNYIRNVYVSDIELSGDFVYQGHEHGINGVSGNGLELSYINLSTFERINSTGNPGHGVILKTHCWALSFNDCLFNVNGVDGFNCTSKAINPQELNGGNLRLLNCYLSNNLKNGLSFNGADLSLVNSLLEGNEHAVNLVGSDFETAGINFTDCDIEGNLKEPFLVSEYDSASNMYFNHLHYSGQLYCGNTGLFNFDISNAVKIADIVINSSLPITSIGSSKVDVVLFTNLKNIGNDKIKLFDVSCNQSLSVITKEASPADLSFCYLDSTNKVNIKVNNINFCIVKPVNYSFLSTVTLTADKDVVVYNFEGEKLKSSSSANGTKTIECYCNNPMLLIGSLTDETATVSDLSFSGYVKID
jgi:hypothetical protein|nr:MAG TPA: tail spike protein [Caudoviricetes sp.]